MSSSLKVAVIGAGVSGLIAARELQRESHHVVVFEKSHRLGGTWAYNPQIESDLLGVDPSREIVYGSLYKSLETNLPRELMSFTDFKFDEKVYGDPRSFPGHEEVIMFLEDFASHFELTDLIRFNTLVTRIAVVDSEITEFVVELKTSGVSSVEVFDAVVICNGHNTEPNLPTDIPGASGIGIGAVLQQGGHSISLFSKSLSPKHQALSTYEKEFLAVLMALDKWRGYLLDRHFKIKTYHFSLKYLLDQMLSTPFQIKWLPKLMGYDCEITYKQASENVAADALSRINSGGELCAMVATTVSSDLLQKVKDSRQSDIKLEFVLQQLIKR